LVFCFTGCQIQKRSSPKCTRRTRFIGISGQTFHYKFSALIFVRIKKKAYKFKLAFNVEGLGAFDDVFVQYLDDNCRKLHIFIQLKSELSHIFTMEELLA
jgi:hypothetical protein